MHAQAAIEVYRGNAVLLERVFQQTGTFLATTLMKNMAVIQGTRQN